MSSFFTEIELSQIGLKSYGKDVRISRYVHFYSPETISIGDNVRIDDFCILSGKIDLGSYIHIAASCLLFGGNDGIVMEDYSGISSRSAVYAESDDYSGDYFTNPMLPKAFRHLIGGGVIIRKHAIIGTGCSIMPGVVVGEGCAIGSMCLVNKSQDDWGICVGIPCKRIKERSKKLLELENSFYHQ